MLNDIKVLDGKSKDIVADNIEKLKGIFPEVFCENRLDFERLQEILGRYIENKEERYRFEWNGKSQAIKIAQTSSIGTLRPCKEESKDWSTTQNLYIEGDNLEVLKLLQKSYQNKIKMIYIDPPYNTGNDFIYKDDFKDNINNYLKQTTQIDEHGNKVSTNSELSGRYHTDWLNMIYPRLKLARNLLKEDGIIFISIDDKEAANLKKICDDIFGEINYVGNFVKQSKVGGGSDSKYIAKEHENLFVFAKNINLLPEMFEEYDNEYLKRYKEEDENGRYYWDTFSRNGLKNPINYDITAPDGTIINGNWIRSKERFLDELSKGIIRIIKKQDGNWSVQFKQYLNCNGKKPRSMTTNFGATIDGKKEIKLLFNNDKIFPYPKSTTFISKLIKFANVKDDDYILDFFSGSSTTAHSVIKFNCENKRKIKFIMVQIPEKCDKNSEAYKAGYKNISEIGKERIRRAGDKIIFENKDKEEMKKLDVGFKVLKLDSSNVKKWNPDYNNLEESFYDMLENFISNRTEEDIVYEIILKYGFDLTYPVIEKVIKDKKIFIIGFGALIICLDNNITLNIIENILEIKKELSPEVCRVVLKDNGFESDSVKANAIQMFNRNDINEVMSI